MTRPTMFFHLRGLAVDDMMKQGEIASGFGSLQTNSDRLGAFRPQQDPVPNVPHFVHAGGQVAL